MAISRPSLLTLTPVIGPVAEGKCQTPPTTGDHAHLPVCSWAEVISERVAASQMCTPPPSPPSINKSPFQAAQLKRTRRGLHYHSDIIVQLHTLWLLNATLLLYENCRNVGLSKQK